MQEKVYGHIAKYARPADEEAAVEYVGTLGLWIALFWAPWWTLPLHALVTTRLFVVGVHDAGHLSLFSSPQLNEYALRITSPLFCMPGVGWWKPGHNYHHHHSNDLDYEQGSQTAPFTVRQFRAMKRWQRALYRYFATPIVVITQTAPLGMTLGQLIRIATWEEAAAQAFVFFVMFWTGVWMRYAAALVLGSSFGVFLFHLQHTYPECIRKKGKDYFENGFYGSSFLQLPEWLKLFTAGIEYHHIHHLNARVPSYRLRACHDEAPPSMWNGIRRITLREGWDALRLVLWSETKNRLVSFEDVDKEILLA